jgi:peptide/nickel transport system substrate-binding protein
MHWKRMTAVAATLMIAVAACGSPSSNKDNQGGGNVDLGKAREKATDPTAKGPAPEVEGAKKGGTITVLSDVTPDTFDPTNTYYVDGNQIEKLYFRALTQYRLEGPGLKPVLVPDLADLGTVSADKLTWTFKLKKGIKYQDGTPVKAEDYAYAIKRSFAHNLYGGGPSYQIQFFKDGDKYKGPYGAGGDDYAGVETPNDNTLVIHLRTPFPDMPYYAAFPLFTPIPKSKDSKKNYEQRPMSTGPYQVVSYTPGAQLKLTKNPFWDPATDPVRHQYVDGFDFKFGQDTIRAQRQVLASSGPDANALNYSNIDASLLPEIKDQSQLVKGPGPCTNMYTMDTRKIPLEIRKVIAKAYPYDSYRKVAGLTPLTNVPASTILPPAVPGFEKYTLPGMTGTGKGADDPAIAAAAGKDLQAALQKLGRSEFELSWYYQIDDKIQTQVMQVRKQAYEKVGFKVRVIGVPKAKYRTFVGDQNAPVNIGKTPAGWCSDWPSGTSWFPVLFKSDAIELGNSAGQIQDKALDAEIDKITALDPNAQLKEWSKIDKKILQEYLPVLPLYYSQSAFPVGKNIGHAVNDVTQGMPEFTSLYLKQP